MTKVRNILVALSAAAMATGCIYERQVVRERSVEPPPPPPADTSISEGDTAAPPVDRDVADTEVFYEQLSPYGYWTFVGGYGRVWVPYVSVGWRPYYFGRWVLTDWGWTFASDDPWGWAGYHYGRWNWGIGVGWYWIPGTVWGPAWVSWRYGGGYAAWCPLGPPGVVFGYSHPAWVAVREEHFTRPISTVAVSVHATAGAVSQAAPLTGVHATAARSGSFGPPIARVQAATGKNFRPVAAASVVGRGAVHPTAGSAPATRAGPMRSPQPRGVATAPAPRSYSTPRVSSPGNSGAPGPRGGMGGGWGYAPRASPGGGGSYAPRASSGGSAPRASGGGGSYAPHASGGGAAHAAPSGGAAPHASGGGGHSSGGGHK
jgi:hypothetical protein